MQEALTGISIGFGFCRWGNPLSVFNAVCQPPNVRLIPLCDGIKPCCDGTYRGNLEEEPSRQTNECNDSSKDYWKLL